MKKVVSSMFLFSLLLLVPVGIAHAAPPVVVTPPSITGDKQIFEPLSLNVGAWENMSTGTYFHQWQRKVSGRWQNLNAFGEDYIPGNRDVGRYLRVQVVAYNGEGETEAFTPAYFIRGTGINGVEIYPGVSRIVSIGDNGRVDMGRVLCLEGYCKIQKVVVRLKIAGSSYKAKPIFSRKEIAPNRTRKIAFQVPSYLTGSLPATVKMHVKARSSNGNVLARTMTRKLSY